MYLAFALFVALFVRNIDVERDRVGRSLTNDRENGMAEIATVDSHHQLPSFKYSFPKNKADQKQPLAQGVLEPYVSVQLGRHLKSCCNSDEDGVHHVVDVGGNFGWFTLMGAASNCNVDTFEPVPWFNRLLRKNVESNEFEDKVVVHDVIVSNKPGELSMSVPDTSHALMGAAGVHGLSVNNKNYEDILRPALALDDITWPENLGRSCAMKVDVEGWEPYVFLGAVSLFERRIPEVLIIELSPGMTIKEDPSLQSIYKMLASFKMMGYTPHLLEWGTIKSPSEDVWNTPLAEFEVDWDSKKIVEKCGFNCMLYMTA